MTRYRVLPYKKGSRSAKALATALGGKVLRLENSSYVERETDVIINWGNSKAETFHWDAPVINGLDLTQVSNKLKFFELMKDTGLTPQFWTEKDNIPDEAFPIVCRKILTGHSGAGIDIAFSRDGLCDAPLYVKYEKKKEEYRVHVGIIPEGAVTIAVQRKARRLDHENPNWLVRNHANGFVFSRVDVNPPSACVSAAYEAVKKAGLDFGAVDVVWNEHNQQAFVLEINSAPGLEGSTVEDYKKFFLDISP